jgi:hypothetical protein
VRIIVPLFTKANYEMTGMSHAEVRDVKEPAVRAGLARVPGPVILAGVLLLVVAVLDPWLVWLATATLLLGGTLLVASCFLSWIPGQVSPGHRGGGPGHHEEDDRCR